jgi:RNA polymerase sigma-70 factor (ECF subfamily)
VPSWFEALLDAAPPEVADLLRGDDALASALQAAILDAQRAWPHLELGLLTFAIHVGARLPERPPIADVLPTLQLHDLFLACACTHGLPRAALLFEQHHAADVRRGLGSAIGSVDEMQQDVMHHVLVAAPDRPPRIAAYTGRGGLGRWVSVVTRRRVIDLGRAERPDDIALSRGNELAAAYGDPELAMLQGTIHDAFRAAIERAAAALQARDRNVLRYVYVHKLRMREVAAIYRVDVSTIKRRVARIRKELADAVRDELRSTLGLDEQQLDGELAELPTVLPVTLSRILKAKP